MGKLDSQFDNTADFREALQLTLDAEGAVSIPEGMRTELGYAPGDRLLVKVVDAQLVIRNFDADVRRAQAMLAPYLAGPPSVVDELITERRAEAERD